MIRSLRAVQVTLVIRQDVVHGATQSSVASAKRAGDDTDGLERAIRDVLGELLSGMKGSPQVRAHILLGCHAVRLRRLEGIPHTLKRGALDDFFREGLSRLIAVRPEEVACAFVREGDAHLLATYDRQALVALYEVATRLDIAIETILPELIALAAPLRNGFVETRDGRLIGRLDVVDGAITRSSLRRVATDGAREPEATPDGPLDASQWTRKDRRRFAALAAPRPQRTVVQVSRARARAAVTAAASAALLVIASGPLETLYERAFAQRDVATMLATHAGVLEHQRELLTLRETIAHASQLAVAQPSALRTIASLTQALPDEMSLLHLELDSLGGSVVILAARAGEALARFDRVAGITGAAFSGPITRETSFGQSKDRATIAFRLSEASRAR